MLPWKEKPTVMAATKSWHGWPVDAPPPATASFDTAEKHTELIRCIKTLEKINDQPVAEFWQSIKEQQQKKSG